MKLIIDTSFDVRIDTPPGRDPDTYSAALRDCHLNLWSKGLPSGDTFNLTATTPGVYLTHKSGRGVFRRQRGGNVVQNLYDMLSDKCHNEGGRPKALNLLPNRTVRTRQHCGHSRSMQQ